MNNLRENYLIGMDLGTTNIKAILIDDNGNVLFSASRKNSLILPGAGMAEQDAEEWWRNAVSILSEISISAGTQIISRVRGICISSQTVTMLPVDRSGHPLHSALIWMDTRSARQMHEITARVGHDRFVEIVGSQPDAAFLPNKILWYRQNFPELFENTYRFLQASSFLNMRLTGRFTMDYDQASRTQCLDQKTLLWSKEIGDAIGICLDDYLPAPQLSTEIIGSVTRWAAEATGLAEGTPVVAGASDAITAMYASGLTKYGEATESSGTSSLVFVGAMRRNPPGSSVTTKPCALEDLPYVYDAPITSTGAALKWYLDTLGQPEREYAQNHSIDVFEHLNEVASQVPAGSRGVMFLPYLQGERAPLWQSHARGTFLGLSLDTKHEDLCRAVFEGTAFAIRHVCETIRTYGSDERILRITGGGAKSRTWAKIKASVLRMPVLILDEKSGDVPFGDCLIAGHAAGVFPDLTSSIKSLITVKERIEPDEGWADVYDAIFPYYLNFYKDIDGDLRSYKNTLSRFLPDK